MGIIHYPAELKDKRYLVFVVFSCGMAVMILELSGARLIAPHYGNSFFVWTSVIGVILTSRVLEQHANHECGG